MAADRAAGDQVQREAVQLLAGGVLAAVVDDVVHPDLWNPRLGRMLTCLFLRRVSPQAIHGWRPVGEAAR